MTRRLIQEDNVRNLLKMKRSYYVSLPIQVVREFKWKEGQKVVVEKRGREIVVKDWKKRIGRNRRLFQN